MDWLKAIGGAVTGVFQIGNTWIEGRNKRMQAKADAEAQVILNASRSDADWVSYMAEASKDSWKDEFWTIIFAIPLVLCFFPEYTQYVFDGFKALDQTPDWYRYALLTLIGASVGVKQIGKGIKEVKK